VNPVTAALFAAVLLIALFSTPTQIFAADGTASDQDASATETQPTTRTYNQQDLLDAQTNHSEVYISDTAVPLASFKGDNSASDFYLTTGSLINTVIAAICAVSMILIMVALTRKNKVDFSVLAVRTVAVSIGLLAIVTWSLFDKLSIPAPWFNDTSTAIIILFTIYLAVAIASFVLEAKLEKGSEKDY
jgi:hypothetical protein